jgi:hypothetical protein
MAARGKRFFDVGPVRQQTDAPAKADPLAALTLPPCRSTGEAGWRSGRVGPTGE